MGPMRPRRRIGFLLFDGVTALDLVGPLEAFAIAAHASVERAQPPAYEVLALGLTRRACVSESGLVMQPRTILAKAPALDTLIIPGGSGLRRPGVSRQIGAWIARRARRIRRIASVCTGIYGLAPSGLLDGCRATTHWRFAADVARAFPRLKIEPDALFIKAGHCYTSAGITAGIDLALALIEEDLGPKAAMTVARELVVHLKRDGGQEQFSEPLRFQISASSHLSELPAYIVGHLEGDLTVEALARQAALSPRQLSRSCRAAFGASPAVLVQRLRLDAARSRLTARGSRVEQIASSVGFRSADVFQRAFRRRFGVSPKAYRARFSTEEV